MRKFVVIFIYALCTMSIAFSQEREQYELVCGKFLYLEFALKSKGSWTVFFAALAKDSFNASELDYKNIDTFMGSLYQQAYYTSLMTYPIEQAYYMLFGFNEVANTTAGLITTGTYDNIKKISNEESFHLRSKKDKITVRHCYITGIFIKLNNSFGQRIKNDVTILPNCNVDILLPICVSYYNKSPSILFYNKK